MTPHQLTLDTSVVLEYLKGQSNAGVIQRLIQLAHDHKVEIVVTETIREDVPGGDLAEELARLPLLDIRIIGTVARVGRGIVGRDRVADDSFAGFYSTARRLAELRVGRNKIPDRRDLDHLHAHLLWKRDVFLTFDRGMLCLAPELLAEFRLCVMSPQEYLETHWPATA